MRSAVLKRFTALLLMICCICTAIIPAMAAKEEEPIPEITHTAIANTTIKIRRAASLDALGCGSIPKHNMVNICEYGDTWCKVVQERVIGWVQTKYLDDIRAAIPTAEDPAPVDVYADEPDAESTLVGFTMTQNSYEKKYVSHAVRATALYKQPNTAMGRVKDIPIYDEVTVGEICGQWTLCCYQDRYYGYVPVADLFKWDRIDPYAGEIPGLDVWPTMAYVNQTTPIYSAETGEVLKTINAGSAISVSIGKNGRANLVHYREDAYILTDYIAATVDTVPYEQAQSGDLLSVFTTYFPVGVTTLQQQGRNWNIYLAGTYITGTVLQPGQTFDMNEVIGPYVKATGYKSAPIMSPHALSGYGGGTCQVNTTVYNTVIALPILVTHRKVHAEVGIYYCKKGFDAAVGAGDINMTLQNTMPYAIRFQMYISDGVLTCCIYRN